MDLKDGAGRALNGLYCCSGGSCCLVFFLCMATRLEVDKLKGLNVVNFFFSTGGTRYSGTPSPTASALNLYLLAASSVSDKYTTAAPTRVGGKFW